RPQPFAERLGVDRAAVGFRRGHFGSVEELPRTRGAATRHLYEDAAIRRRDGEGHDGWGVGAADARWVVRLPVFNDHDGARLKYAIHTNWVGFAESWFKWDLEFGDHVAATVRRVLVPLDGN